jgi:hypothetical protein
VEALDKGSVTDRANSSVLAQVRVGDRGHEWLNLNRAIPQLRKLTKLLA